MLGKEHLNLALVQEVILAAVKELEISLEALLEQVVQEMETSLGVQQEPVAPELEISQGELQEPMVPELAELEIQVTNQEEMQEQAALVLVWVLEISLVVTLEQEELVAILDKDHLNLALV